MIKTYPKQKLVIKSSSNENEKETIVEAKVAIWTRESHGLFDYENRFIQYIKHQIEKCAFFSKQGDKIIVEPINETEVTVGAKPDGLLAVYKDEDEEFYFKVRRHQNIDSNPDYLVFLVVRGLINNDGSKKGYELDVGDIIKFGRCEYRIIEFREKDKKTKSMKQKMDTPTPFKLTKKVCTPALDIDTECRICKLNKEESKKKGGDYVFINPCNCKGEKKYIHLYCLRSSLTVPLKGSFNDKNTCLIWKKQYCQDCKAIYPDFVEINKVSVELFPFIKTDDIYLLLERLPANPKSSLETPTMYLISFQENKSITLGRSDESDIVDKDVSVSRNHAHLKYENGKFLLFDENSKFGTIVLLRRKCQINTKKTPVQIGTNVITFSTKRSKTPEKKPPTVNPTPDTSYFAMKKHFNGILLS